MQSQVMQTQINSISMCDVQDVILTLQNNPLYIEAFETTDEEEILRFHNIAHCALDAVEKAVEEDRGVIHFPSHCTLRARDCKLFSDDFAIQYTWVIKDCSS